jgi:hypothetical protein
VRGGGGRGFVGVLSGGRIRLTVDRGVGVMFKGVDGVIWFRASFSCVFNESFDFIKGNSLTRRPNIGVYTRIVLFSVT